jgi:cytidylate kinase
MAVITISRQMGSLGCDVANEIARCMNYKIVWREVINEAAVRAGVPEVALATIDELGLLGIKPSQNDLDAYHAAVREIMHELNQEDNVVIVGRAGQVILREEDNVMHVRIYAPFDLRAVRVAEKHRVSMEVARKQVKLSDQSRTRYLKKYYDARWDDPDLYDLQVSTAHFNLKTAALIVCKAIEERMGAGRKV